MRKLALVLVSLACLFSDPAPVRAEDAPSTRRGCFDEYKALLADCNKTFGGSSERQACYEGARIVLTDCLDRLRPRRAGLVLLDPVTGAAPVAWLRLDEEGLYRVVVKGVDGLHVSASAILCGEKQVDLASTWDPKEGILTIKPPRGCEDELVTVIVAVSDDRGVVDATAISLPRIIPCDFNGDGRLDGDDATAVMQAYENDLLSSRDVVDWIVRACQ